MHAEMKGAPVSALESQASGTVGVPKRAWYAAREMVPLFVMFALAALAGLGLRSMFLDQPVAGFHMFNEGFYMDLAARDAARGVFDWFTAPLDFNNPPLYSAIVAALFRIFGVATTWARLVSVLAGVGTVTFTFLLGKTLFTPRIGVLAGALVAVTPGLALVDHNIQVDALFLCLLTGATWLYVLAARSGRSRDALLGGAMLGLSLITKQSAVVALAALALWEVWRGPGLKWLAERRTWLFVAGLFATGAPWFVTQLLLDGKRYVSTITALSGNRGVSVFSAGFAYAFGFEFAFLLSVLATLALIPALWVAVRKRTSADQLVLSFLLAYGAFYVLFHQHSYYLIVLAPFALLLVARALSGLMRTRRGLGLALTAVLLLSMAVSGSVMLAAQKWSGWAPGSLQAEVGAAAPGSTLYATFDAWANIGPALINDNPDLAIVSMPQGQYAPPDGEASGEASEVVLANPIVEAQSGRELPPVLVPSRWLLKPVFFGRTLWYEPYNTNFFGNRMWRSERVGSLLRFGFVGEIAPSGWRVYDGQTMREITMAQ